MHHFFCLVVCCFWHCTLYKFMIMKCFLTVLDDYQYPEDLSVVVVVHFLVLIFICVIIIFYNIISTLLLRRILLLFLFFYIFCVEVSPV